MEHRGLFSVPPERENLNNEIKLSSRIFQRSNLIFIMFKCKFNLRFEFLSSLSQIPVRWSNPPCIANRLSSYSISIFILPTRNSHQREKERRRRRRRRGGGSSSSFQIQRIGKRWRKRGREDVQWEQVHREAARDLRSGLRKMTVFSLGKFEDNPLARLSGDQKRRSWSPWMQGSSHIHYRSKVSRLWNPDSFISVDIFHWNIEIFVLFRLSIFSNHKPD